MDIIKVILGILIVVAGFTIPSLILAIRYLKGRKEEKEEKEEKVKKEKKIPWSKVYSIGGAVVAWGMIFLIWYILSSYTFLEATRTSIFWAFQILFLVVLLALLGKTSIFVWTVRNVAIILTIVVAVALIASFTKGGLKRMAAIKSSIRQSRALADVQTVKALHRDRVAELLIAKVDKLKAISKERPLCKQQGEELEKLGNKLNKNYSEPKWPKKVAQDEQSRHLLGILKLPKNKQVINQDTKGRELWYLEGEYVRFQQLSSPGKFTVVNIRPAHQSWTTDRQVVTVGPTKYSDKIRLMVAGEKEIIVQVRIIPHRS